MALVQLDSVSLSFPLLGAGVRKRVSGNAMDSAGAIISDASAASRSIHALDDVSLTLRDGDRLGLVGRNGSGKSTLLRVMAGIYEPQRGSVYVQGRISAMFNVGLGMNPESSGYRNIELLGTIAGFSKKEVEDLKSAVAEFSGLGDYLQLPVRTYSNGMAMRLKFACGTAFKPDILLLDEWLGAGDPEFKKKARLRMRTLVNTAGILVLASHNAKTLRDECDKVLWLHKGKVRAFGDTDDVLNEMAVSEGRPPLRARLQKRVDEPAE